MDASGATRQIADDELNTMENIDHPINQAELEDELEILQRKLEKFRRRSENKTVR